MLPALLIQRTVVHAESDTTALLVLWLKSLALLVMLAL
jgi:hypothetical protein